MLGSLQASEHHLANQARPVKHAHQAQHAQQAQQAQHVFQKSESSSPHPPSAEDRSMPPVQSEALDSNRTVAPTSQFSAVQQAQHWIAEQQHQRKQQHQQQQPRLVDPDSERAVRPCGVNRTASGLSGSTAGNSKPGGNAEESQRAVAAAQLASATQAGVSLEARSNSTEAIWEAQRKTMAFLAARDPKRPPWGQMGDPSVDNPRPAASFAKQSPPLPSAQPVSWGPVGMGIGMQPGRGLSAVSAAPSSSSGGPSPGSSGLLQSSGLGRVSMTDDMQLLLASSSDRMPSQELMNAVKVHSSSPLLLAPPPWGGGGVGWGQWYLK